MESTLVNNRLQDRASDDSIPNSIDSTSISSSKRPNASALFVIIFFLILESLNNKQQSVTITAKQLQANGGAQIKLNQQAEDLQFNFNAIFTERGVVTGSLPPLTANQIKSYFGQDVWIAYKGPDKIILEEQENVGGGKTGTLHVIITRQGERLYATLNGQMVKSFFANGKSVVFKSSIKWRSVLENPTAVAQAQAFNTQQDKIRQGITNKLMVLRQGATINEQVLGTSSQNLLQTMDEGTYLLKVVKAIVTAMVQRR